MYKFAKSAATLLIDEKKLKLSQNFPQVTLE